MVKLQPFFHSFSSSQLPPKTQEHSLVLVDMDTSKSCECLFFFHDLQTILKIQGKKYIMDVNTKMQPVFAEEGPNKHIPQKIILHLNQKQMAVNVSSQDTMEKVYKQLKKVISHNGVNNYLKPLKRLGRGTFAAVYLMQSKATGQKMAAKVFSRQGQKIGYKGKESLQKEINYLKRLSHQNIIRFDGIYETGNLIYVVTEYLSGGNLTQFRRKNSLNIGKYIPKILSDILKALCYLKQQGIMHRDIKPENIVHRQEDDSWVLVDFGIAANNKEELLYYQCGTRGYMAPQVLEENKSQKPYSEACDIYSFGVICYELIVGHLPFKVQMENMHDFKVIWKGITKEDCSELDPQIVKFLKATLQTDPSARWTPQQCLNSQLIKSQKVLSNWNQYNEKKKQESYNKVLVPKRGN